MSVIIMPITLILNMMAAGVSMTYPAVYASDDMRIARDTHPSSSPDGDDTDSTSNATSALIPESSRGPAIPEKGYLV
jgi:hypothetical protein